MMSIPRNNGFGSQLTGPREGTGVAALTQMLHEHGIDTSCWGTGTFKSLEHLAQEIEAGEAQLEVLHDKLCRVCSVVRVDIRYVDAGGTAFRLFEAEQVFNDGRRRQRPVGIAVWEKMERGERPDDAVARALCQELGITSAPKDLRLVQRFTFEEEPLDYAGLPTIIQAVDYEVQLTAEQYCSDGYQERQKDKITFFRWNEVT